MNTTAAPAGRVHVRSMPLHELAPAPYNPRQISPRALGGLGESIRRFGLVQPVIWNETTGHIVGGHQRVKVLLEQGAAETDVVVVALPEAEERALNLALNSQAISGAWTADALALLESVQDELPELASAVLLGDLKADLEELFPPPPVPVAEDEVPEPPEVPITRLGDLWLLGTHRLLCGDSTNAEHVAHLMNGEKASLLASDPPYLVDYKGGNHPQSWSNRPEVRDKHWDDYTDPESGVAFFEGYLRQALTHCVGGVAVYQWFATKRHVLVEQAWQRVGLLAHQELTWVKARPVLTRCHFMWKSEPCMYGWVEGTPPTLRPPPNETTVWEVSQAGEQDGIHPTQKPVELFARPIRWHTRTGEICYEPFSGSGTQIVAAEQLGRRCYAMELSPAYVDVAVTRWETLTGRKAERAAAAVQA